MYWVHYATNRFSIPFNEKEIFNVCVSAPNAINYIHVILNLYNQLNKFVAFKNITKPSMHGCGLCNEARCDRNQPNKAMLVL